MIRRFSLSMAALCGIAGAANAACVTLPNTLTNGTLADATQVMGNFNALTTCVNAPLTIFGNIGANRVLVGPLSGADANPTFRTIATTELSDIASFSISTSGSITAASMNVVGGLSDNGISPTGTAGTGYVRATSPVLLTPNISYEQVSTVCNNPATTCSSTCNGSRKVVGGGALTAGSTPNLVYSYPNTTVSWRTDFSAAPATSITTYAVCTGIQ